MSKQQIIQDTFSYQIFDATKRQLAQIIDVEEIASGILKSYKLYQIEIFLNQLNSEARTALSKENGLIITRRFSDFEKLHKILRENYKELVLPCLPTKSILEVMNKSETEYANERVEGLEIYLNKILTNDFLYRTPEFRAFFSRVN